MMIVELTIPIDCKGTFIQNNKLKSFSYSYKHDEDGFLSIDEMKEKIIIMITNKGEFKGVNDYIESLKEVKKESINFKYRRTKIQIKSNGPNINEQYTIIAEFRDDLNEFTLIDPVSEAPIKKGIIAKNDINSFLGAIAENKYRFN